MALVNNIVIDLGASTATLTSTSSGNNVDTITYTNSTNQIVFSNRPLINISGVDFLIFLTQLTILQQAIFINFHTNVFLTTPFTEVQNIENNNIGGNTWDFYSVIGYAPLGRIVDYSCLGSNSTVNLKNRQFSLTANYPEWLSLLVALNHYSSSIKAFLGL